MPDILKDLSNPALVSAIQANRVLFAADLGRSPLIELHQEPEITWFTSAVAHPSFNRILKTRFETGQISNRIQAALEPFRSRSLPAIWQTGPADRPTDLEPHLETHGLVHLDHEPGMAADLHTIDLAAPAGLDLEIHRVEDLQALRAWVSVVGRVFSAPDWVQEAMYTVESSLGLESYARRLYIGKLDTEPLAASLLFLGAGGAGIYSVGVMPEARQRGFGKAMTLAALMDARQAGYRVATLHASPLGQGIYRRLDFREYCRLGRYKYGGA